MTTVSNMLRLLNGLPSTIDLSASGNALHVDSLQVGSTSPATLTKTILNNLIALQNGTDFSTGTNSHTHDGRYYTETELTTRTSSSGATLVATERKTYAYITGYTTLQTDSLANYNVQAFIDAINTSLSTAGDKTLKVSANDSTPGYLEGKIVSGNSLLTISTLNDGGDEDLQLTVNNANIDHGTLAGLADDDHTQYLRTDGTRALTGNQSFGGFKATNVSDPTAAQDAATKAYVDAVAAGLKPKQAVRVASTANVVIASGLENGDTVDGVTLATGDRVLLKNQSTASQNGIYVVVASGAASRSTDFDSLTPIDEVNGAWVAVQEGTANAGKTFVQYGTVATLGTDPINFTIWDPLAGLVGGDMISYSAGTISVDLATASGLESTNPGNSAGQLQVKTDGSTLTKSASGLKVSDAGITETQLAASVAGAGISGGAGAALAVELATDPALEFDAGGAAGALRVKTDTAGALERTSAGLKARVDNTSVEISGNNIAVKETGILKVFTTLTNNTGSTIAANSLVCLSVSAAGEIVLARANALSTTEGFVGVAAASIANGASGKVQIAGRATLVQEAAFDVGKMVYLSSATAGSSTKTAPSASGEYVQIVGKAVSTTEVILKDQYVTAIE